MEAENKNIQEEICNTNANTNNQHSETTPENTDTNAQNAEKTTKNDKTDTSWEEKYNELNDKFLRLYSEFDNYKKRTAKERIEFAKSAAQDVFVAILPVIDDFDRAIKSNETLEDINAIKDGLKLIHQKFSTILHKKGLEPMETIGKEFDADLHEAITNVPAPSEDMKGKVVDEVEKGYMLNGKVIRYAKVVVGA